VPTPTTSDFSPAFRAAHARLLVPEHLDAITHRVAEWNAFGVPAAPPAPHFAAELLPDYAAAFEPFRAVLPTGSAPALAAAMERARTANLLVLLGQRRTPATLTGPAGIPPTAAELLAAAEGTHRDRLTVAARALAKHAGRSGDHFWGDPRGPVAGQNAAAAAVVRRILAGRTWWNVFGHFAHDVVFEARLPSGHGARWADGGATFVGFLEPFDSEKCPSLHTSRRRSFASPSATNANSAGATASK
jgi:hypothetical protein